MSKEKSYPITEIINSVIERRLMRNDENRHIPISSIFIKKFISELKERFFGKIIDIGGVTEVNYSPYNEVFKIYNYQWDDDGNDIDFEEEIIKVLERKI